MQTSMGAGGESTDGFAISNVSAEDVSAAQLRDTYRILRAQLPATFLSRGGPVFFSRLMRDALSRGDAQLLLATVHDSRDLAGFAILVSDNTWASRAIRRQPAVFALRLAPALLNPTNWLPFLKRAFRGRANTPAEQHSGALPHGVGQHELYMIAVSGGQQRKGCGSALLATTEESFAREGVVHYRVVTPVANERANSFYQKHGLVCVGRRSAVGVNLNTYGGRTPILAIGSTHDTQF